MSHPKEPLWKGPYKEGVSFSLLSDFLVCRERFRLHVIEGFREKESFDHKLYYGSFFHACEEARHLGKNWKDALRNIHRKMVTRYPDDHAEINKWIEICKRQYPHYVTHYTKDMGKVKFIPEKIFMVPYILPSGRVIILRGMIDGIYTKKDGTVVIQENKTKGYIDWPAIESTIFWNLQAMIYFLMSREMIAQNLSLTASSKKRIPYPGLPEKRPTRILYNVIKRPLSDHYSIKKKKGESVSQFYDRLEGLIAENPNDYFMRKEIPIHKFQLDAFLRKMLHPILESLCDWWDHISQDPFNPWDIPGQPANKRPVSGIHYQTPWGMFNSLFGGFRGDYYDYYTTGSERSLEEVGTLFPELEGE